MTRPTARFQDGSFKTVKGKSNMTATFVSAPIDDVEIHALAGISCVIIDTSQIFCEATATLLSTRANSLLNVSKASSDRALKILAESGPDVALIGPNIERQEALELVWEIKEEFPKVQVIVLGLEAQEDRILELIEAGAADYLLRHQSVVDLLRTIVAVSQGRSLCSGRIIARVFSRISQLSRTYGHRPVPTANLTLREKEILALLAKGFSNKEVALTLNITLATVKNHVHKILAKFQVHSREAAVRYCFQAGILRDADRN